MDFIEEMWAKFSLYLNDNNNSEVWEDEDIIKSLFYTLSLLIIDEGGCNSECEFWSRFLQITREYETASEVDEKFNSLMRKCQNEQAVKHFNEFSKIKQGYGVFFALLYSHAGRLVLSEFGLTAFLKAKTE